jgi:hypothetical protein
MVTEWFAVAEALRSTWTGCRCNLTMWGDDMNWKIAKAKQNFSEIVKAAEDEPQFGELRRICEEEDYSLETPPRQERPNPFPDALDELSR